MPTTHTKRAMILAAKKTRATSRADPDIVQHLREQISSHAIPPGSKLRESTLAQQYGVSRTKVREALTALELRGLIKRTPNRGAEVVRVDLTQIFEIYDAREAVEGMCIRLATQKAPPERWQKWVDLFAKGGLMESYVEHGEIEGYFTHYHQLRREIIDAACNPVLAAMLDSIFEKTWVIMRRVQILPGRMQQALEEHRAFVAAMRAGDAEKAEQLRRQNIRSAIETLKRFKTYVI